MRHHDLHSIVSETKADVEGSNSSIRRTATQNSKDVWTKLKRVRMTAHALFVPRVLNVLVFTLHEGFAAV